MSSQPRRRRLEVEDIGDVAVVNFVDKKIIDEQNIQVIGEQLFSVVHELGRCKIVLNFSNVEFLSSAATGKFITLNRMVQASQGRLIFCGIDAKIYEVFEITKLNKLFRIVPMAEAALAAMNDEALEAVCPIYECQGSAAAQSWSCTCPDCGATCSFQCGRGDTTAVVRSFSIPTYQNERIEAILEKAFWTKGPDAKGVHLQVLKISGRLDLFACEVLERGWRTLPAPRKVLFDLRHATEISARAHQLLRGMCAAPPSDSHGTILIDPGNPAQAHGFAPNDPVFADENEAWPPLAGLRGAIQPLTVTVRRAV